jgi:hypothetical protein
MDGITYLKMFRITLILILWYKGVFSTVNIHYHCCVILVLPVNISGLFPWFCHSNSILDSIYHRINLSTVYTCPKRNLVKGGKNWKQIQPCPKFVIVNHDTICNMTLVWLWAISRVISYKCYSHVCVSHVSVLSVVLKFLPYKLMVNTLDTLATV